jgi:SET domain-containing protein
MRAAAPISGPSPESPDGTTRTLATNGNAARFINHSCRGNCYVQIIKGVIWIRAARTIRKGEELSYNYHTDGAAEIPCRCRPGCQGML